MADDRVDGALLDGLDGSLDLVACAELHDGFLSFTYSIIVVNE